MEKEKQVALFDHQSCKSKFFARLGSSPYVKYRGKCPNPHCNRRISLFPEELFSSTDKARREYIRLSQHEKIRIYWQA
jgi:hypothetical protein